ncbi:dihydrolipoamide acetyltransferase family protein [Streptomyces sp. NPDC088921]|uniref:dihydrolipoamide acetyltransferase family protein n=1 Tax=unclassified Streptomyces TaxID=2593676 RepID=UPI00342B0C99
MIRFVLPDVGEGLREAEILAWNVAVGERVEVNQILLEIETAKSVVELPSPASGTIESLYVEAGVTVEVGTLLVSIDDGSDDTDSEDDAAAADADAMDPPLVLVGTGPAPAAARSRRLRPRGADVSAPPRVETAPSGHAGSRARAKPPVRHLAKTLDVDLNSLVPSNGTVISRHDVEAAAAKRPVSTSDIRETRVPIRGVRKVIAEAVTRSAFTAPHVTEFLTVDVTATMEMLSRLKADRRWEGVRLTPLLFVAKALLVAVRRYPEINARWDETAREIARLHDVNLGIAAATPRGLLVPNIKGADGLHLRELATALGDLIDTARRGKATLHDVSGGTITITNIGSLGVDAATPILNPGEAAILAFGAVREMPWVVEGQLAVRQITQLALSFDHRLVDGELGSQVLVEVGRLLHDPAEAFLYV